MALVAGAFAVLNGSAPDDDSNLDEREATHRAFCERLLAEEPRRRIGFDSDEAFIDDCIRAQFDYDRTFGEDAD